MPVTTAPNIAVIILHLQAIFLHTRTHTCYISITTHKEQPPPYPGPNMFQHIFTGFNPKVPEIPSRSIPHDILERWQAGVVIVAAAQGVIPRSFPSSKQLVVRFHFQRRCCWLKKGSKLQLFAEHQSEYHLLCFGDGYLAVHVSWLVLLFPGSEDSWSARNHMYQTFYSHRTTTLTLAPTGRFNTYSKIPKVDKYMIILCIYIYVHL